MNIMSSIGPAKAQIVTDADIVHATSEREFREGRRYAESMRVRGIVVSEDGSLIEATTQGTAPRPYRERIALHRDRNGRLEIRGLCTCPVGGNCKHVAAVLMAARREQHLRPKPPQSAAEEPLAPEIGAWLSGLDRAGCDDLGCDGYPANVRSRIFYVLNALATRAGPRWDAPMAMDRLSIRPVTATLRKDGRMGQGHPLALGSSYKLTDKAHLLAADRIILHRLSARLGSSPSPEDDPPRRCAGSSPPAGHTGANWKVRSSWKRPRGRGDFAGA